MSLWKRIRAWLDQETKLIVAETWEPNSMDDPRCLRTFTRQRQARQNMKRKGIKSLLDGRPAWSKVVTMGDTPEPAKVVPMRRAKR